MPPLHAVQNRIDDWITDNMVQLRTREENYFGTHGEYWQGLWTHTVLPMHNPAGPPTAGDTEPDSLSSKPERQTESWLEFWPALNGLSMASLIRIDVYSGPYGDGFVLVSVMGHDGNIYTRLVNEGPETWRDEDWTLFVPTPGALFGFPYE